MKVMGGECADVREKLAETDGVCANLATGVRRVRTHEIP